MYAYKDNIENLGINMNKVNERFNGNYGLIKELFIDFTMDCNFIKLKNALSENNYKEAFIAAHTLKGICDELYIEGFGDIICRISYLIKDGNIKQVYEIMPQAEQAYKVLSENLKTFFGLQV